MVYSALPQIVAVKPLRVSFRFAQLTSPEWETRERRSIPMLIAALEKRARQGVCGRFEGAYKDVRDRKHP